MIAEYSFNGMLLCEVKGHPLHTIIFIRGCFECIAARNLPYFAKRASKNFFKIYEYVPIRKGIRHNEIFK